MLRILVVDDSPTARQLLTEVLSSDHDMVVVGVAKDGLEAVEMTKKLRPDLVTMDVQMPRMDGFEATKEIMMSMPTPIVLVSASTLVREVDTSMRALRAGALTLVLKPSGPDSPVFDKTVKELIATVKAMAEVKVVRHHRRTARPDAPPVTKPSVPHVAVQVVAIATSTGGPPALQRVLAGLPADYPVPILVVQHIAPGFTEGLAAWLDSILSLHVKVAEAGEPLAAGRVYIAPEDRHLGVSSRGTVVLSPEPPIGGFRPSGTFLFDSVARAFGESVVALILTGMGDDGVEGLRAVRSAGGLIVAQDEASSVVYGMPGAAAEAGLVDMTRPLDMMAAVLLDVVKRTKLV